MATASSNNISHIKHGFICPECLRNFRTQAFLLSHFDEHTNRQKTTIKNTSSDLLGRLSAAARRKTNSSAVDPLEITDIDESRYKGIQQSMVVPAGVTRSHIDDLKDIRRERLDHRISEANMLITRIDRLLRCDEADRKQAAEELVLWVDGKVVSRCPNCTQKFNVISRRQHHCRLCGSVMCNSTSCSAFLTYNQAREIVGPLDLNQLSKVQSKHSSDDQSTEERIRLCTYCWDVLESRRRLQINQHMRPRLCELYDQLVHLKQDIQTSVDIYHDMHGSLTAGETVHLLQDAQSLHSSIAQKVEIINSVSHKILSLQPSPINAAQLHLSIRQATSHYIKEHLATLPALPTPQQIEKIKAKVASDNGVQVGDIDQLVSAVRKVVVTTGWNGENAAAAAAAKLSENPDNEDPLIQQINIVREYIRQAREAQRYEEVATLKENLTVLKRQFQFQLEQQQQHANNQCQRDETIVSSTTN